MVYRGAILEIVGGAGQLAGTFALLGIPSLLDILLSVSVLLAPPTDLVGTGTTPGN